MDGNSLKFEVVGPGGEEVWLSGRVPEGRRWLVQVRRIGRKWHRPPEKNASATTSLIPKDAESIFVPG